MTYAIFKAAGFQYRAEPGDVLRLPTLDAESGETVTFDEVLLGVSEGKTLIGRPTLEGAAVRAQVLRHGRADKIVVFKFKRRKNYRRKSGHRQGFTEIRVSDIDLGDGRRLTVEPQKKTAKKAAAKTATKKTAAKKAPAKKAPAATAKPKAEAKQTAKPKTSTGAKGTRRTTPAGKKKSSE